MNEYQLNLISIYLTITIDQIFLKMKICCKMAHLLNKNISYFFNEKNYDFDSI